MHIPWDLIQRHAKPDEVPVDTMIRILEEGKVSVGEIINLPGAGVRGVNSLLKFLGIEMTSKSKRSGKNQTPDEN